MNLENYRIIPRYSVQICTLFIYLLQIYLYWFQPSKIKSRIGFLYCNKSSSTFGYFWTVLPISDAMVTKSTSLQQKPLPQTRCHIPHCYTVWLGLPLTLTTVTCILRLTGLLSTPTETHWFLSIKPSLHLLLLHYTSPHSPHFSFLLQVTGILCNGH